MKLKNNEFKIFITGANGQLAKSFSEFYPSEKLELATKKTLNVLNKKNILFQIENSRPDFVFHFASMTRGDECAKNPELAYKINVGGTKNVVEVCKKLNIPLLFVSTNEVFDGMQNRPYKENDRANPITVAGSTKLEAELVIKENLKKYFIIRTSWLFSERSKNFLHAILAAAKENHTLRLVSDEVSSPTYTLDLCDAILKLIKTKKYGIYHISNLGEASRLEFAKEALKIKGTNYNIESVKLADYKRFSKPPLYTPLNNDKAIGLGIKMPTWKNSLERFLISYEK